MITKDNVARGSGESSSLEYLFHGWDEKLKEREMRWYKQGQGSVVLWTEGSYQDWNSKDEGAVCLVR